MWIGLTLSLSFKKGMGDNQDFKKPRIGLKTRRLGQLEKTLKGEKRNLSPASMAAEEIEDRSCLIENLSDTPAECFAP